MGLFSTPPPPPGIPNDVFDRALALARQVADQEVAATRASYDRFVRLITTWGSIASGLILILGAFLGWTISFFGTKTVNDAKSAAETQATAEVTKQLPPYVQKAAQDTYNALNLQDAIKNQLNDLTREQLDQMIRERVGPIVRAEVDKRRDEIITSANRQAGQSAQVPGDPSGSAAPVPTGDYQDGVNALTHAKSLLPKDVPVVFYSDRASFSLATTLQKAFIKAGWNAQGSIKPTDNDVTLPRMRLTVTTNRPEIFQPAYTRTSQTNKAQLHSALKEGIVDIVRPAAFDTTIQGTNDSLVIEFRGQP